jgi:hypothetical protein
MPALTLKWGVGLAGVQKPGLLFKAFLTLLPPLEKEEGGANPPDVLGGLLGGLVGLVQGVAGGILNGQVIGANSRQKIRGMLFGVSACEICLNSHAARAHA